jgi:ketosteroid isomerase-like protein
MNPRQRVVAQTLLSPSNDSFQESTVILFQDLNFWTAVGQIGMGAMAGIAVGVVLKRVRYIARPPRRESRICPGCGAPALQRVRGTSAQRVISMFTRQAPYACMRCDWPTAPRTMRKTRGASKRSHGADQASFVDAAEVNAPVEASTPSMAVDMLQPARPAPPVDLSAIDRAAAERAAVEIEQPPARSEHKDDATAVKESVYYYVALLNAGDASIRANCFLSEFTSFAIDGGPLQSSKFERRAAGSVAPFDLRCRDLRVYIYKDTAIATAYLIGKMEDANGKPIRVTGRSTWVHLRQNGEWKLAHSHVSPLNPEA